MKLLQHFGTLETVLGCFKTFVKSNKPLQESSQRLALRTGCFRQANCETHVLEFLEGVTNAKCQYGCTSFLKDQLQLGGHLPKENALKWTHHQL
jgi:hypothetical protein